MPPTGQRSVSIISGASVAKIVNFCKSQGQVEEKDKDNQEPKMLPLIPDGAKLFQ